MECRDAEWTLAETSEKQARAGDISGALTTVDAIAGPSGRAYALRLIAQVQAKAGDVAGAAETREQALLAAASIVNGWGKGRRAACNRPATGEDRRRADRVDARDMRGTLVWAATHGGDPVAKLSALVISHWGRTIVEPSFFRESTR